MDVYSDPDPGSDVVHIKESAQHKKATADEARELAEHIKRVAGYADPETDTTS